MQWAGLLGLILTVVVACGPVANTAPPPPTTEAALGYLDQVVALVAGGDVLSVCSLGSGTCAHDLRNADLTAVPRTSPAVLGTRVVAPSQRPDGIWMAGGRVLEVCGIDGNDRPYYSELLVFYDGDRLISTNPLFWSGIRVTTSATTAQSSPRPCI
jgi:hypothetical protein